MSGLYGNSIAHAATAGVQQVNNSTWVQLSVGSSPQSGRIWLQLQVKGPMALALQFVNKNADGTFTTPTDSAGDHTVIPANSIHILPIGDSVAVFGLGVRKAGSTASSTRIALVEFS